MDLKKLSLKDKDLIERFLGYSPHELSVYNFANIYIWRGLFDIFWTMIEENLCLFFRDKVGTFMYLAPLGAAAEEGVIAAAFKVMDSLNPNPALSRIENIEANDADLYRRAGYLCRPKDPDYLCRRKKLAELKGDPFKAKRACVNHFVRNYKSEYRDYRDQDRRQCLELYQDWMSQRASQNREPVYQGTLEDNLSCLKILLADCAALDCLGRVVEVDGEIRGFTFGFRLNPRTFCILFEITELAVKGLSQYIFQRFCAELTAYTYVNIMDDSGLANLKKVKASYRPERLIPNFIATRKDG